MARPYGYSGKILKVDLSSRTLTDISTQDYSGRFVGGKGLAAKIYWDEVSPHIGALDPENRLIIATGPMAGFTGVAGSLCQVHAKSPYTVPEQYRYGIMAGFWGARLKMAGCDAIVVQGQSERPVYLLIREGCAALKDASHLWGRGAVTSREMLKEELGKAAHVLSIGPAGENLVTCANILGEGDASAGQGLGAVMGSKRLKAIAVLGNKKPTAARPEALRELIELIRRWDGGSESIPPGMRYGVLGAMLRGVKEKPYPCFGCISHCWRNLAETHDGVKSKRACHSGNFYQGASFRYYGEYSDVALQANRLCNEYGLDSMALDRISKWLLRCYEDGSLTEEHVDIPLSKAGSLEYIETLTRKVACRKGFGNILAQGLARAIEYVGGKAEDAYTGLPPGEERPGGPLARDPRTYIYTGPYWATEPRYHIGSMSQIEKVLGLCWLPWVHKMVAPEGYRAGDPHPVNVGMVVQDPKLVEDAINSAYCSTGVLREAARRFWGGELAVDFSTYEGKALAARKMLDRAYANDCMVFCSHKWPMTIARGSGDHVGDPTLESRLLSAVTGRDMDETEYARQGERIVNLVRAIRVREGLGGRDKDKLPEFMYTTPLNHSTHNQDCLVPGKNGMLISRRSAVLDRDKFAQVLDEYYRLRGWDVLTGLQTKAKLHEISLADVAVELAQVGLAK